MPLRLIDSSVWIAFLRPRPDARIAKAVRRALAAGEAAVAAAVVVEVLSGIRDADEYVAREADLRALPVVPTDGEAPYLAARIGEALAAAGRPGKTVDLLLAGAALAAGAELWSLRDQHFVDIRAIAGRSGARGVKAPQIVFLP